MNRAETPKTLRKRMFLSYGAAGAFFMAAVLSGRHGFMRWSMLAPAILWLGVGTIHYHRIKAMPYDA